MATPELRIYESLSQSLKPFQPLVEGHVGMYVCGPTVYSDVHLGNVRTFLSFDMVFRYLSFIGYKVRYVRNITDAGHLVDDVDHGEDKIAKKARLESLEPMEIVQRHTVGFHEVMKSFNALPPSIEPTATGHVIEQIALTEQLISNGFAYEVDGSVYFDVTAYEKIHNYGELSGRKAEDMLEGSRNLAGQSDKRNPRDFALWKRAGKEHIMRWQSPWGEGFPGWHLECSVMSTKYLGETFDIHGGGMDLKFPHHECEIAQNKGSHGHAGAQFWMHANMLTLNGQRMSKSTGNTLLPEELLSGKSAHLTQPYSPSVTRFFIHQAHYRSVLDFSDEALNAAKKGHDRLMAAFESLSKRPTTGPKVGSFDTDAWSNKAHAVMAKDFNSPLLIAELFEAVKAIAADRKDPSVLGTDGAQSLMTQMSDWLFHVLGLMPPQQVNDRMKKALDGSMKLVISLRQTARETKDWATSDAIRDQLDAAGIIIKDGSEGSSYELK